MTDDIDILARTLWGEARGEGLIGQAAYEVSGDESEIRDFCHEWVEIEA